MRFNNGKLNNIVLLLVLLLSACGGGGGDGNNSLAGTSDFPVNEPYATALIGMGMPEGFARFFAASKRTTNCTSDTTCTYSVTYPNGAIRNVTLTATPNQQYTPTADELARKASVSNPVYDGKFSATGMEDDSTIDTQLNISFFVPTTSIPNSPLFMAPALPMTRKEANRAQIRGVNGYDGIRISWSEMGKKGADAGIGEVLGTAAYLSQWFGADTVTKWGNKLGSVYKVAGILNDSAEAMKIFNETKAWLDELTALEKCANNPTNSLTQTDPNYSARTVANLEAARARIIEQGIVRILNVVDETSEGFTMEGGATLLTIPMKQAHEYVEQTQKDLSAQEMKMARDSVVSCTPTCPTNLVATGVSESQIDLSWSGSIGANTVTGYNIHRDGANVNNSTATSWSDTGLTPSTTYCYMVSAYNDYGSSGTNCAQACARTLGPPTVYSTSPLNNATNVAVNSAIAATFSEAMDAKTITTGTFTLSGPSGPVSGTVTYSGFTATFTPSADLQHLTTYAATITTGVKDLGGSAMKANYTWSFTTGGNVDGNLQFVLTDKSSNTGSFIKGNADITWHMRSDSNSALTLYWPSGTITADISYLDCDPVHVTKPISSTNLGTPSDATDDGGRLDVYSSMSYVFPNTYWFWLHTDSWDQTFYCGKDRKPQTETNFSLWLEVGTCTPGVYIPYTDAARLTGTLSCADYSLGNMSGTLDATWDFKNLK